MAIERIQPTLPEAMQQILLAVPNRILSYADIFKENRRRRLYVSRDGKFPGAAWIRITARPNLELFDPLGGGKVQLRTPAPKGKRGK